MTRKPYTTFNFKMLLSTLNSNFPRFLTKCWWASEQEQLKSIPNNRVFYSPIPGKNVNNSKLKFVYVVLNIIHVFQSSGYHKNLLFGIDFSCSKKTWRSHSKNVKWLDFELHTVIWRENFTSVGCFMNAFIMWVGWCT